MNGAIPRGGSEPPGYRPSNVRLEVNGSLTRDDRQQRKIHEFTIPDGATRIRIEFRYWPGEVNGVHNLLTLALFDPARFRGTAHRWKQDQVIIVDRGNATPGFLPGPIDAGPWRVELDAHEVVNDGTVTGSCKFSLLVETTDEPVAPTPEVPEDLQRDGPGASLGAGARWYRGDLHSHSTHCDGESTIADMALAAAEVGLDFLATTAHNTISHSRAEEPWPRDLLRIQGVECTTHFGHANILGATDWIDWRVDSLESGASSILGQAHRQGALAVVNHPCALGNPTCTGCRWDYSLDDAASFDAIEVWNSDWESSELGNARALSLWTSLLMTGSGITAVAGTDAHSAGEYQRDDLPYTWIYASDPSERQILAALGAGRAYLSRGPTLAFVARDELGRRATLPGDRLRSGPFELAVMVSGHHSDTMLWLIADGAARPLGRVDRSGGVVRVKAAAEGWWRIELRGDGDRDELLAVTNPVRHMLT